MPLAAGSVTGRETARRRSTRARAAMRAHARTEVASACRACGEHVHAQRSTRLYCSSPCRQRAYRAGGRAILAPIAHQRRIREREAARDPRPVMASLDGCTVEQVSFAEAKAMILAMNGSARYRQGRGLATDSRRLTASLQGSRCSLRRPSPESRDLCGPEHRDLTISLARGACVHWAHPHAASFLIPEACKLAAKAFGWRVFNAYADSTAGEIGTVYQAVNWLYLGVGNGAGHRRGRWRFFNQREGRWRAERTVYKLGLKLADLRSHRDWIPDPTPDKGRYVWFEGDMARETRFEAGAEIPAAALSETSP